MKFLEREEWRAPFETILGGHLFVACHNAKIEIDDLGDILGPDAAMNLWGCAFEDFLARELLGGRNMVDDYLKRRSYKESGSAKAYMKAIRTSVMSLYEVSEIVPGRSFLARDLIRGGDLVRVIERTASTMLKPWDRIGARVVVLGGGHQLCGGLLLYDFETAEKVTDKLRWFENRVEREMHAIAGETGSTFDVAQFKKITANGGLLELAAPIFTRLWLIDALEKALNPRSMDVVNSDGDAILFCTLRFPLAKGVHSAAVRVALEALPELEQESDTFFNWISHDVPDRSAPPLKRPPGIVLTSTHSLGGTILGSVEIKAGEVIVTTNSRERSERAGLLIGAALGAFVGTSTLEIETLDEARANRDTQTGKRARKAADAFPPDERHRLTHAFLDEHYRKTLDQPIASLGNRSPRVAIRTAAGREQVINWLKLLENRSGRGCNSDDPLGTYVFDWMWEELGVAAPRRHDRRPSASGGV